MGKQQRLVSSRSLSDALPDRSLGKLTTARREPGAPLQQQLAQRSERHHHVLVRMNGSFMGEPVLLGEQLCVLGRAPDADVWVGDVEMSRRHASIESGPDSYEVKDLGSANGTFVDGQRITRHGLRHGEIIQLGPNTLFRYERADRDHYEMLARSYEASVRDSLTGAYNRNYFADRIRAELAFARRHESNLSLLMLGLDHLKRVNDEHGHRVGDEMLIAIARVAENNLRPVDVFVRYGGEEFAVILPDIPLAGAVAVAEGLRRRIAELRVDVRGLTIRITVSIGCASLACCEERSVEALVAMADRRLYAAKRGGRNRVEASS